MRSPPSVASAPADQARLSVMLVDGHRLFRDGLRGILEEHGIGVGEAGSSAEAVSLAAKTEPDVAVMDIELAGSSGIEVTRRLRRISPLTRVLILTASAGHDRAAEAIQAGAYGYVLKDSPVEFIVAGVRAAAAGELLLSPCIAAELLRGLRNSRSSLESDGEPGPRLTARELDVLRLLADGRDNVAIGAELVISKQTVKSHVSSVLAKLGVENRVQAAVLAVRAGLL